MKEQGSQGPEKTDKRTEPKDIDKSSKHSWGLLFLRDNQWFWGITFLVVVLLLFTAHFRLQPPPDWQVGTVATKEVRAPFDLQVQDDIATNLKREEARTKIPPIYDWDTEMGDRLQEKLFQLSQKARGIFQEREDARSNPALSNEEKLSTEKRCRADLEELLGPNLTRYAYHQIEKEGFSPQLEETLRIILKKVSSKKIVSDEDKLSQFPSIRIRDIHKPATEWEVRSPSSGEIITLSTARRFLMELLDQHDYLTPSMKGAAEEVLRMVLVPNLTFNSQETVHRQDEAARDVSPLVVFIKKGQPVIRIGEVVDGNVKQRLKDFQLASQDKVNIKRLLSLLFLSIILILFAFMYLKTYKKREKIAVNLFNLVIVLLLFFLVITHISDAIFKLLAGSAKDFPMSRADLGLFLIPFAAGALLVTVLVDRHIAVIFSFLLSIFVGMLLDLDFRMTIYVFMTSISAIYAGLKFRQKRIPLKTSLLVAFSNVILVVLFLADDEMWTRPQMMLYPAAMGFLSSMPLLLMLTATLLPIFESFYGIVSDARLVELSSLNHPLLQRLAITAPGTYNHSIMISHLAESAASSIGANGLFCRVASYYHDIGKVMNPNYFIENQYAGLNPHDRLNPRVSALIVQSHVREGVLLARNHKLPEQITDVIPQHHGTRNISYFYDRALTIVDPEKETINKSDFCYPGPKPKTREAAIIMLADSIEASSRILKDPSPQRVRTLIGENFERILSDSQFDECDITLNEIALLKEGFFKVLMGVFARRISYPNYDFDKGQENGKDQRS